MRKLSYQYFSLITGVVPVSYSPPASLVCSTALCPSTPMGPICSPPHPLVMSPHGCDVYPPMGAAYPPVSGGDLSAYTTPGLGDLNAYSGAANDPSVVFSGGVAPYPVCTLGGPLGGGPLGSPLGVQIGQGAYGTPAPPHGFGGLEEDATAATPLIGGHKESDV